MIRKRLGMAAAFTTAALASAVVASNEPQAQAGVVVSITKDFLQRGQSELLREFVAKMNRVGQDAVYEVNLGTYLPAYAVMGLTLSMSGLKITEIGNMLTSAVKEIDLEAECQCIKGKIGPVDKVSLGFDYSFRLNGEPIEGSATITMYDFVLEYNLVPEVVEIDSEYVYYHEQGMLHLRADEFNFSALDFPVRVFGNEKTVEIKNALDSLFSRFLDFEAPLDEIQKGLLEKMLNESVLSYEQHTRLYDNTLEVDYQLVGQGVVVTDDYISLIMDGTFHSVRLGYHESEESHEYLSELPLRRDDRGPAQIMISDYSMQSLINASLELQWYDLNQTMNGDALNNYIKGFSIAYGDFTEIEIKIKPVAGSQRVTFNSEDGLATLTCLINLHVENPFADRHMDAVTLDIELVANMRIDITPDYKVTGMVEDLTTEIIDFKPYFHSYTTEKGLSAQLAFIDPWAISYLNNLLQQGLDLPLPEWLIAPMTEPRVETYDGYILFDTEPREDLNLISKLFLQ